MIAIANAAASPVKIYTYLALQDHPILLVGAPISKPLCISLQLAVFRPSKEAALFGIQLLKDSFCWATWTVLLVEEPTQSRRNIIN